MHTKLWQILQIKNNNNKIVECIEKKMVFACENIFEPFPLIEWRANDAFILAKGLLVKTRSSGLRDLGKLHTLSFVHTDTTDFLK